MGHRPIQNKVEIRRIRSAFCIKVAILVLFLQCNTQNPEANIKAGQKQ